MSLLPVVAAGRLAERPAAQRWLVEELWSDEAVGIVGGEPKCCKSFLALDLAVAVATGTPCLGRFRVTRPGRVLLYAAEDALHVVRTRLEGICRAAGHSLEELDVQVITAPSVRLDVEADRRDLEDTVIALAPRLVVLDPFVRLHRIDENASGEVAPLLAYLRELQRRHRVAVLLVHHARKSKGGTGVRAGQALRGSSEFHAWGDSNLYLRRCGDELRITVEHRAAPSTAAITVELRQDGDALRLEVVASQPAVLDAARPLAGRASPTTVEERVLGVLAAASAPMNIVALRDACRIRMATLSQALAAMVHDETVVHTPSGYRLAADAG